MKMKEEKIDYKLQMKTQWLFKISVFLVLLCKTQIHKKKSQRVLIREYSNTKGNYQFIIIIFILFFFIEIVIFFLAIRFNLFLSFLKLYLTKYFFFPVSN